MFLGLRSDLVPMYVRDDYAETVIAPRISMVNGVSQVQVQGAQKYAVRVQVDPNKLRAQGIGLNEVNQALQNWNVNIPTGQLFGPDTTYNIHGGGQLMNADAFKSRHPPAAALIRIAAAFVGPPCGSRRSFEEHSRSVLGHSMDDGRHASTRATSTRSRFFRDFPRRGLARWSRCISSATS